MKKRLPIYAALMVLGLSGCSRPPSSTALKDETRPPLVQLPSSIDLSPAGHQLILDQEVGGGKGYYNKFLVHPEWPGGASGTTIGVGSDLSTVSKPVIRSDWAKLPGTDLERLVATQPFHGKAAIAPTRAVHDISVAWVIAEDVFDRVDVVRTTQLCRRTFPGFEALAPDARASILSLVFNRGSSMTGSSRIQMRAIRDLVPQRDYRGMAAQLRAMIPLWEGTAIYKDMRSRREAEARLMESCAH